MCIQDVDVSCFKGPLGLHACSALPVPLVVVLVAPTVCPFCLMFDVKDVMPQLPAMAAGHYAS